MRSLGTATKSSPCLPQLEKARVQQRRPNAAKIKNKQTNKNLKNKKMTQDGLVMAGRPWNWGFEPWDISPNSQPPGMEEGLETEFNHMANDSVNHPYVMKPQ